MVDVFVSYAREDARRVEPLVALLEGRGCSVWWARDLPPGDHLEAQIEEVVSSASSVLVALTEHAAQSDWVRSEAVIARQQQKVIPVLLDDVPVPDSLRGLQVADLRQWPNEPAAVDEVEKLVRSVAARAPSGARPFIGRIDVLATLHRSLGAALDGSGCIVMVSGEPGIGKTRCAEEFTRLAEDRGALVLWGRCYEQPGAPAYWPWVQVLEEYIDAHSDDELRIAIGSNAPLLSNLVPEVGTRLGTVAKAETHTGDGQFRLFDAITRMIARAAANVPIVLVLDDLHWADGSSLALLEYLSKEIRRHRCLIVCAYRDVEVTRRSPLISTLGELSRASRVERVRMIGLSAEETAELTFAVSGMRIPPGAAEAIYQQTDGNPLFVNEVAHALAHEQRRATGEFIAIDVPDGIREAIGRSLDRLSEDCNELLTIASVLGRDFDLDIVARTAERSLSICLEEVDEAVRGGVVQRGASARSYRFAHAVIRETLYAEIPTLERLQLHRRVADALVAARGGPLEPVLSVLAYHYSEAAALGDHARAVEIALLAAEHDERISALEESCRHYDNALRLLDGAREEDVERAALCHLNKGRILLMLGRWQETVESFTKGIGLARRLGDAALFNEFAFRLVRVTSNAPQQHAIALAEEALRLLPEDDIGNRATAFASLAFALRSVGDVAAIEQAGEQAIALARRTGDASVLVQTMRMVVLALRGNPASLEQRLRYGAEAIQLCDGQPHVDESADVLYWQILNLVEAGLIDASQELLDRYSHMSNTYHLLRHRLQADLLTIAIRHLRGHWTDLEQRIEQVFELGQQLEYARRVEVEGAYGAQMFVLNRDTGRLRAMAPVVCRMIDGDAMRMWLPGVMAMCCEIGLLDRVQTAFEQLAANDFAGVPHDDMWLTCMVYCAEACTCLGDGARAKALYARLLPYAEQTANHPATVCFGAAETYLGMLAHTMGDRPLALDHYQRAADMNRAMGAWPALARTQMRLARALLESESEPDRARGRQLMIEAEQLAGRLGMAGLVADIRVALDEDTSQLPDGLTPREVEVLKLLAIGRSNKDISRVLSISLSTVATHVRSILTKSGSANRTEAAAYAMRQQLT